MTKSNPFLNECGFKGCMELLMWPMAMCKKHDSKTSGNDAIEAAGDPE